MSESDRDKLLKLRGIQQEPVTLARVVEHTTRRSMTEAEEKLIDVCMTVSLSDFSDWRSEGFKRFASATREVFRERMPKDAPDKLVEAKKAYDEAYAKLKEIKAVVPSSIREEIYKEHGWDTRHA